MRGKKKLGCWVIGLLFLLLFLPVKKCQAASRVFDIVIKDGYVTQKVGMLYGKTPYGYTGYFAEKSVIAVDPRAKKVTFSVRNARSGYDDFSFQHKTLRPTDEAKGNLFSYSDHGRRRAFYFTVKKVTPSRISAVSIRDSSGKSQKQYRFTGKNKVAIRCTITSDRDPELSVEIRNQKKQIVYRRKLTSALDKKMILWWNGTASSGNEAGLKKGEKLPAGIYTITVKSTVKCGKKNFISEKKKMIRLAKSPKTK